MNKPVPITLYQVMTSHGLDDSWVGSHIWDYKNRKYFARKRDAVAYAAEYPLGRGPRGAGREVSKVSAFRVGDQVYLGKLDPVEPE